MVNSPPVDNAGNPDVGLPNGLPPRCGESSKFLIEADLLVGGDVPRPWDDTGDLIGEGDL
jgi:hypothetical protein